MVLLFLIESRVFLNPPGRVNLGFVCGVFLGPASILVFWFFIQYFGVSAPFNRNYSPFLTVLVFFLIQFLKVDGQYLPRVSVYLLLISLIFYYLIYKFLPLNLNPLDTRISMTSSITLGILIFAMFFMFVFPGKTALIIPSSQLWKNAYKSRDLSPQSLDGRLWPVDVYRSKIKNRDYLSDWTRSVAMSSTPTFHHSNLIDKSKHMYLTLITSSDFVEIAQVWAFSLLRTKTNATVAALVYDTISNEELRPLTCLGVKIIRIHKTSCPKEFRKSRFCSAGLFSKLLVFNQTAYDSVVFLDADIVVTQNIDDLFLLPFPISVALNHPDCSEDLNGGFFVVKPRYQNFKVLSNAYIADQNLYPHFLPINSFFGHFFLQFCR
ncbi:hypothetical protein RCL1_004477 [Eukaryota sp. TZLM3-RCL]